MDDSTLHTRSTRWSRGLIVTGIIIAVLNMALAWSMMFLGPTPQRGDHAANPPRAQTSLEPAKAQSAPARPEPPGAATTRTQNPWDSSESPTLGLAKLMEMYQGMAQSQERQMTLLLGFCFALISIGFSLFVMGIEGAARFKGDAKEFGSLTVKVSSPGLFCIFLASMLVALSFAGSSGGNANEAAESKADVVRAESDGKEQLLRTEAQTKEEIIRAEADAKERLIDADTRAKRELLEAEADAKERLLRWEPGTRAKK